MRHAYWRRSDNTIYRPNDNKHAPTRLLNLIGTEASVDSTGRISWQGRDLLDWELAIQSSIVVLQPDESELNEADSNLLISKAIQEIIIKDKGGKPVDAPRLLDLVNKRAKELYNRPKTSRLLVTSLSVEKCNVFPIDVFGFPIENANRADYPYHPPLVQNKSFVTKHVRESRYHVVSIETSETTVFQAFDRGMTALNCLRGVWSLIATYCESVLSSSVVPKRKWIGKIHVGPIHGLYDAAGTLTGDNYWCDMNYVEDAPLFAPRMGWDELQKSCLTFFEKIETSPFKQELIELFARYAIALDQTNLHVAFLMLWSLLEKITDTVGKSYDDTIERAIWPFSEQISSKQLLNQLRLCRNQFVHSAETSNASDRLCYVTRYFVDHHFVALLYNYYAVNSLKEYGEFLALPHDLKRLEQLADWYKRAFEMRKPQSDDDETKDDKNQLPSEPHDETDSIEQKRRHVGRSSFEITPPQV